MARLKAGFRTWSACLHRFAVGYFQLPRKAELHSRGLFHTGIEGSPRESAPATLSGNP